MSTNKRHFPSSLKINPQREKEREKERESLKNTFSPSSLSLDSPPLPPSLSFPPIPLNRWMRLLLLRLLRLGWICAMTGVGTNPPRSQTWTGRWSAQAPSRTTQSGFEGKPEASRAVTLINGEPGDLAVSAASSLESQRSQQAREKLVNTNSLTERHIKPVMTVSIFITLNWGKRIHSHASHINFS